MKKFGQYLMEDMIAAVTQKGNNIYIYNETGRIMAAIVGGQLMGYTPSNVSVKKGDKTIIYNNQGRPISVVVN
jgi:hypothetical protein